MPTCSEPMPSLRDLAAATSANVVYRGEAKSHAAKRVQAGKGIASIVENGMCVGCGLCESVAGRDSLQMTMGSNGFLRPVVAGHELAAKVEDEILTICPGLRQHKDGDEARADPVWGVRRGTYVSEVVDGRMSFEGASGGAITAITTRLIEADEVKSVLHVMADPERPMRSVACVSQSREDIRRAAGSRYGPVAPLTRLHEVLDRGEPFAFVGKPCDVAGVRNMAKRDARIDKLMRAAISFPCGGLPSHSASVRMAARYGFAEDDISLMRHRGHGCPGPTRIEASDGRAHEQDFDDTWFKEFGPDVQFRCKICPDSMGEQADIVCGDAWDVDGKRDNVNLMIARTKAGAKLIDSLAQAGVLKLKPLDDGALDRMQPHHRARKIAVAARLLGLLMAGQMIPSFRNMGLIRSAIHGWRDALANMLGARARAKAGGNRESAPRHIEQGSSTS
ncbi:coenzyme F420 hydrogenase [Rhodopseudomonas boonkerdii]|nr:coenzyme F420 hydrogenase [Rhodopseudomonas boonkerdii]